VSNVCEHGKCGATKPQHDGAKCSASTQCESGNCMYSKCAPKVDDWGHCYKDVSCKSGKCTDGKCAPSTPTPAPEHLEDGSHCKTSAVCKSGNCEHSKCSPKKHEGSCYKVSTERDARRAGPSRRFLLPCASRCITIADTLAHPSRRPTA